MSKAASMASVFACLTEEQARAVYDALAQWADNERNGLDEADPGTAQEQREHARLSAQVALVEGVVADLEAELVRGI